MFLRQLKLHRDQLQQRLGRSNGQNVEQELAQTRQFLSATKDPKWRAQLIKRIKQLEQHGKGGEDGADVQRRFKMVDDLYQVVQHHPDYNKTRKRRSKPE
jgi:hypothetical protein